MLGDRRNQAVDGPAGAVADRSGNGIIRLDLPAELQNDVAGQGGNAGLAKPARAAFLLDQSLQKAWQQSSGPGAAASCGAQNFNNFPGFQGRELQAGVKAETAAGLRTGAVQRQDDVLPAMAGLEF